MTESKPMKIGRAGEELAKEFLVKNRFRILEQNFRCRFGEVDIIAQKKDTVHFIEVKTRSRVDDDPESFVHYAKQKRLKNAALWYVSQKDWKDYYYAFDVMCIIMKKTPEIIHYENAFTL